MGKPVSMDSALPCCLALPEFFHYFCGLAEIDLRVDLRDDGRAVAQYGAGCVQAGLATDLARLGVAELIRMPGWHAGLLTRLADCVCVARHWVALPGCPLRVLLRLAL